MRRGVARSVARSECATRSLVRCVALAGFFLALPHAGLAAEPAPRNAAPRTPGDPLPIHDGVLSLSLSDAVNLGIQRNLDVDLIRYDPEIAEERYGAAWGAYDPELYGTGGYTNVETPTASQLIGRVNLRQEDWYGDAGVQGLIPWVGGSYQAGYRGSEVQTNSRVSTLSPEFRASYLATISIPLLRGLFWSDAWTLVRTTRIGARQSVEQFRSNLMDIVRTTEDDYWRLIASQDDRRVAEKSLETALALLDQTQAQYEVGVVSKVEVVQAEAGVADREFRLIRAQAVERNAQDVLIDNVLGPYLEPETELAVEATDRPEETPVREVSAAAATERAMARRPELEVARSEIERRKVDVSSTSNARLPQLDVVGSYGESGIAGSTSPSCVSFSTGEACGPVPGVGSRFGQANDDLFNEKGPESYSIEGILSIPLGNNTARHQHQQAKLELRRAETSLRRLEQSIVSEIRRSARNLRSAIEGIEAAERARIAAAEQLRAERTRLEYGESTPFDVLLREEDLVTAEAQKILAEQAYHNAVTALDRAQGTILDRHQIVVEEAAALR
jgi:outer membrane protein TolC